MANFNLTSTQLARFWSRVQKSPDGCWEWVGGRTAQSGYFVAGRGNQLHVHRLMFTLECGHIPTGKTVKQTCGNRFCVRPDHLRLGQYAEHHSTAGLSRREMFDRHIDKSSHPGGCWLWTGAIDSATGYGHFKHANVGGVLAHRFAYGSVPKGLVIDHLCRNRRCVNPAHLEAVPQRINMLRGEAPAAQSIRNQMCLRGLHRLDVEGSRSPNGRCRECYNERQNRWRATLYGVTLTEKTIPLVLALAAIGTSHWSIEQFRANVKPCKFDWRAAEKAIAAETKAAAKTTEKAASKKPAKKGPRK